MRRNVNLDLRAELTNISISAVPLPFFSAVGEKGVLGDFDLICIPWLWRVDTRSCILSRCRSH